MVGILGLQRAQQHVKFRKAPQILEAGVFQKKRPARKSAGHASIQPLKSHFAASQHRKDAGDLVVGVVCVPKCLWRGRVAWTPNLPLSLRRCTVRGYHFYNFQGEQQTRVPHASVLRVGIFSCPSACSVLTRPALPDFSCYQHLPLRAGLLLGPFFNSARVNLRTTQIYRNRSSEAGRMICAASSAEGL